MRLKIIGKPYIIYTNNWHSDISNKSTDQDPLIVKGIKIPTAIEMFVSDPAGPLTSPGTVSIMNFGPKTQLEPAARPNINTPIENTIMFEGNKHRTDPKINNIFDPSKHFRVP